MSSLLDYIRSVLKTDVPENVQTKLSDEAIDVQSFIHLTDENLKELGFKMGHRALLLNSFKSNSHILPTPVFSQNQQLNSSADTRAEQSDIVSVSVPAYDVRNILQQSPPGTYVSGGALVAKLDGGHYYERHERLWMIIILARYLMENAEKVNYPTRDEKIAMATAITTAFPVLKDDRLQFGYEVFYDPISKTGYLEYYMREGEKISIGPYSDELDSQEKKIVEEFTSLYPDAGFLKNCWTPLRDKVLDRAKEFACKNKDLEDVISLITDDLDEDKKTEISFLVLPFLLIPTAKRGVKKPKVSRKLVVEQFFQELLGKTVDEAVRHLTAIDILQPVLFRTNGQYYIKLDNTACCIHEPSCFSECVDFFLHVYYVFNVEYPLELKLVYRLLESVVLLPSNLNSRVVSEFLRSLS